MVTTTKRTGGTTTATRSSTKTTARTSAPKATTTTSTATMLEIKTDGDRVYRFAIPAKTYAAFRSWCKGNLPSWGEMSTPNR